MSFTTGNEAGKAFSGQPSAISLKENLYREATMNGLFQNANRPAGSKWTAGLWLLAMLFATGPGGCGKPAPANDSRQIVYICSETEELIVGPPQSVPAVNPITGRRTLLRGGYCAECRRWYALPSSEHAAGNPKPMYCRKHNVLMSLEGPIEQPDSNDTEGDN